MKLTNKQLNEHFGHMEDHQYRHFNKSLNCMVEGKEHFIKLLERGKLVPFDMAQQLADEYDKNNPRKDYVLSAKAREIINAIKLTADKDGHIQLGNRAIRALREVGLFPTDAQIEAIQRQMGEIK